jgi:uncharacterized CHY-type Zn-finger protein
MDINRDDDNSKKRIFLEYGKTDEGKLLNKENAKLWLEGDFQKHIRSLNDPIEIEMAQIARKYQSSFKWINQKIKGDKAFQICHTPTIRPEELTYDFQILEGYLWLEVIIGPTYPKDLPSFLLLNYSIPENFKRAFEKTLTDKFAETSKILNTLRYMDNNLDKIFSDVTKTCKEQVGTSAPCDKKAHKFEHQKQIGSLVNQLCVEYIQAKVLDPVPVVEEKKPEEDTTPIVKKEEPELRISFPDPNKKKRIKRDDVTDFRKPVFAQKLVQAEKALPEITPLIPQQAEIAPKVEEEEKCVVNNEITPITNGSLEKDLEKLTISEPPEIQYDYHVIAKKFTTKNIRWGFITEAVLEVTCKSCNTIQDIEFKGAEDTTIHLTKTLKCQKCPQEDTIMLKRELLTEESGTVAKIKNTGLDPRDIKSCNYTLICDFCNSSLENQECIPQFGIQMDCFGCKRSLELNYMTLNVYGRDSDEAQVANNLKILIPMARDIKFLFPRKLVGTYTYGRALPKTGNCKHTKNGFRYLRFPCCAKAYPCEKCHNEDPVCDHDIEKAKSMICGYCAAEQIPIKDTCLACNKPIAPTQLIFGTDKGKPSNTKDDKKKKKKFST